MHQAEKFTELQCERHVRLHQGSDAARGASNDSKGDKASVSSLYCPSVTNRSPRRTVAAMV